METKNTTEIDYILEVFLPYKFQTIQAIINDNHFQYCFNKNFDKLLENRRKRPSPPAGFKYRRTAFDKLWEQGRIDKRFFLTHIESIWSKNSLLSSDIRKFIQALCDKTVQDTVLFYQDQEKNRKELVGV
jgi:hypothetical protein